MSVSNIRNRVRKGLESAASRLTSDGNPLTGTITRTTGADETTYPPTPGTSKNYSFSGLMFRYTVDDMRGTDITARDVRVMVSYPVKAVDGEEIVPLNGDTLSIAGVKYQIADVMAEGPGGVPLFWYCQCRAGD